MGIPGLIMLNSIESIDGVILITTESNIDTLRLKNKKIVIQ